MENLRDSRYISNILLTIAGDLNYSIIYFIEDDSVSKLGEWENDYSLKILGRSWEGYDSLLNS